MQDAGQGISETWQILQLWEHVGCGGVLIWREEGKDIWSAPERIAFQFCTVVASWRWVAFY